MARILAAFACGLLFSLGLTIAQMINPQKVLNFLDVAAIPSGGWDPSLALVLCSAVATTAIGYRIVFRFSSPLLAPSFSLPSRHDIDWRLMGGAIIFGVGWGLVGLCPGPALAIVGVGGLPAVVFAVAMLAGMGVHRLLPKRPRTSPPESVSGTGARAA